MKAKINYKSKKTIIIASILLVLIVVSAIAIGMFIKANKNSEAVGGNNIISDDNNNNTNNKNEATESEANKNNQEEQESNEEEKNSVEGTNKNPQNTNGENIPNQEYVVEKTETIPEKIIAKNYYVLWKPMQFETSVNGNFSKANIEAKKTVAKVTANGILENPQDIKVGEILKYTITLTNKHEKINGVATIIDNIPAGTEFISATQEKLKTTPVNYENPSEITILTWENVKVEAGKEVNLVVYVKVIQQAEEEFVTSVQNKAIIIKGNEKEEVESPETKVANILAEKTSKVIYNEQKPHNHIAQNGIEPLHEQDIIEYTIKLTNVGTAEGTVKVTDTVPEGTTLLENSKVTVEDKNGISTYEMQDLVEGINVAVNASSEELEGIATVTFSVKVNSLEETKVIKNDMAKVDGNSTNTTEDNAEKLYINVSVQKTWSNMDNEAAKVYGLESIKLQLLANNQLIQEKVVTRNDNWATTFEKLPKYDEKGNEIDYTVVELGVNNEEQKILDTYYKEETNYKKDLTQTNVVVINTFLTNKLTDTVDVPASKVWLNTESDAGIAYKLESIKLQVLGNNNVVQEKEVTAKDNWQYIFKNLPKYDENGNEITYTVAETATNKADQIKLDKYIAKIDQETGIITNTFDTTRVEDKTDVTANKVWNDDNNKAGVRPESVEFVLVKDGEETENKLVASEENNWTVEFTNLNKYTAEGKEIVYTVKESQARHYKAPEYSEDGLTVTNTVDYTTIYTSKTANKVWNDDNNKAEVRPTSIEFVLVKDGEETESKLVASEGNNWTVEFTNLNKYTVEGREIVYTVKEEKATHYKEPTYSEDGLTVTNTVDYTTIYTSKTANKVWNDDNNKAGVRPEGVELILVKDGVETKNKLVASEENNWTVIFTNINKYTAEGKEIVYTVKESQARHYKAPEYSEDGLTVTNTVDYTTIYTSKTANKVWNDDNNKAKVRPTSIEFVLVKDGEETESKLVASEGNNWTVEFTNLNKYTAEGKEIVYTVKEEKATHYKEPEYSEDGLTVTNTVDYTTIYTSKTANKVWNDDNNKAGVRPESVELILVKDGKETENRLVASEENNWTVTFTNLNKYTVEGKEIVYTVKESQARHYKAPEYSEDGLTVTNTVDYTSITTSKVLTKIWEDNSNKFATRPERVVLTVDGKDYVLTSNNDEDKSTENVWTLTANDLQKYDEQGNEIVYTAIETNVPQGYIKVSENGTTVTNRANAIAEKTAHKETDEGLIGAEVTTSDIFEAGETVYYKLTFKNAGNTTIESKTLTDTLPLRTKLLSVSGVSVTNDTANGTDSNGYVWTVSKNSDGRTVINWLLSNVPAGEVKELTIKAEVVAEAEYKDLCAQTGEETQYTAKLFVRKDGNVPYEGSQIGYDNSYYTASLGTVSLKTNELFYDAEANLKNDDLYYLIKNNNQIVEMISKGISREALEQALKDNGITLTSSQVVVWYVIKNEDNSLRIDGVIRNISELTSITNEVYMDNEKQDDVTINLENIEIGQRGVVSIKGTSSTTATVSTPMDVVFILDTSGSMSDPLSNNNYNNSKANSMVNAVNTTINTIMSKNSNSRIGVVAYSDNASTIIPLGNYSSHEGNYLALGQYMGYKYIQSNISTDKYKYVTGGTNPQSGIKLGAEMLTADGLDRTFTTTVDGIQLTGKRTPVIILVTDGEPTYYYPNQTATGDRYGNGSGSNENYYYWTIRTAKYYKEQVTAKYYGTTSEQAKMFTIGIGLDGTLAKTMLKPSKANVDVCKNSGEYSEERKLYNLLNSSEAPYIYDYADGTASGALTETDIQNFLNTSISASSESLDIRAITIEESKGRRINLNNLDTTKAFSLEILQQPKLSYSSLAEAQAAGYVKLDTSTNTYYIDLKNIDRTTTVNVTYWEV